MSERDIGKAAGLESDEQLALLAELMAEHGLLDDGPTIPRRDVAAPLVLSHAQLRLWYVEQLADGAPVYNIPIAVALPADIDVELLERAMTELVRRHEILRLRIPARDGAPAPELAALEPFAVERVDLRELEPDVQTARCTQLLADEAARPFELASGPLVRMRLVCLAGPEWLLSLTIHHLVADAWSMTILVRELGLLCQAFADERPSPLTPLRIQYFDYAAWQRRTHTPEALAEALEWWVDRVAGLEPFELPADRPPPSRPSFRGARRSRQLAPALAHDLRRLATDRGVTSFVVLYAGLVASLARIGARSDIAIGTVMAGRDHPEVHDLIGLFANTVVLRVSVADDPSVAVLLDRCRAVVLDASAHADVPLHMLVQRLGLARTSQQPLFRVALVFARERAERAPMSFARRRVDAGRARFDLTLYAIDDGRELRIDAEYDSDRFEAASIERVLEQYAAVLAAMPGNLDARVSTLSRDDPDERAFVLQHACGPSLAGPPADIVERFIARVDEAPAHAAVLVFGDDPSQPPIATSYVTLARWSAQLAVELRAHGIGPGDAVALLLPRDASLLAAILAVLAVGATLVPLSIAIPPSRRAVILRDTAAALLLTREAVALPPSVRQLDPRAPPEPATHAPSLEPPRSPASLRAYVLHTSGSTGRPKGVAVGRSTLAELIDVVASELGLGPDDRVLATSAVTFDIALVELLAPLCVGATVVLGPDDVRGDPRWLRAMLDAAAITFMQSTPSTWAALVSAGWRGSPTLRMLAGGEVLSAALARALVERGGALWNGYGPTEATIYSTFERVEPERGVCIGRPLAGRLAWVLDESLAPAPVGAPGLLYLGGGLAEGYLGQPRETAASFVPAPAFVPAQPGARLYATGDRARLRADGRIEFLGRSDRQVKVRGFRIELAEIEGALAKLGGVRRAAVHVVDDVLEAYLERDDGAEIDPAWLHAQLAEQLPVYMLPARYREVASLPTTSSGKLDRAALERLAAAELRSADAELPRSPTERQLAALWTELLELDADAPAIARQDNFYLRGGHSLLAVRLAARGEASFGVRLPLRAILEAPTLAGLAARIDELRRARAGDIAPIERGLAGARAPLSPSQASIWRFCAAVPNSASFNLTSVFELPVELPTDMLERALARLIERHATLRTRFDGHGDQAVQWVDAAASVALRVVDLSELPADEQPLFAMREQALARLEPLDLSAGQLLRALLVRMSGERSLVALTVHHIAADGWSLVILIDELAALCEAEAAGRVAELPELRFSFADYAVWQQARRNDLFVVQLDYWRRKLAGLQLFGPPRDHDDATPFAVEVGLHEHSLSAAAQARVAALSVAAGTSPYVVVLAVTKLVLGRWAGSPDVRVSTLVANRDRPGSEGVVGCFLNSLLLRTRFDLSAPLLDAVERVRATVGEALEHQDLPLDLLLDALEFEWPRAELARVQIAPRPRIARASSARQTELLGGAAPMFTTFDLFITIDASLDGVAFDVRYRPDRYHLDTIAAFVAAIDRALAEHEDLA